MIPRFLRSLETCNEKDRVPALPAFHHRGICPVWRVSTISNQPQSYQFSSHPEHAAYAPMSSGQSVVGGSNYSSAQGERPASDFPQAASVSLGTVARELRKQHAQLKKSRAVWVN